METKNKASISNDLVGIDKYSGSFEQDELGVTCIPTQTIITINDLVLLGLFCYLASRPKDWILNAKQLCTHFTCGKNKMYSAIEELISLGFLTRTTIRSKGQFVRYHYRLHIRQKTQALPFPENREMVQPFPGKPDTVFEDTYKTYNIQNIKTTTTETSQDLKDFISGQNPKVVVREIIISEPVDKRLLLAKEQRPDCYTELEAKEFLLQCAFHLRMGDREKFNQSQQVSGLCKIIIGGTFQAPKGYNKNKLTPDQKRETEISQQLARKQAANKPKHITQTATEYLEQIKSAFRSPSNAT